MELFDLYTKDREKTGKTMVRGERAPDGLYRIVVHVCVFNSRGEMLIQRRQPFKHGWSGMWDVSVGGGVVAGESSLEAAQRELFEEVGLKIPLPERPHLTIHFDGGFDDIYLTEHDCEISSLVLQPEEVCEAKWASQDEILEMIGAGTFIPYHKELIKLLFFMRNRRGTFTRDDKNE